VVGTLRKGKSVLKTWQALADKLTQAMHAGHSGVPPMGAHLGPNLNRKRPRDQSLTGEETISFSAAQGRVYPGLPGYSLPSETAPPEGQDKEQYPPGVMKSGGGLANGHTDLLTGHWRWAAPGCEAPSAGRQPGRPGCARVRSPPSLHAHALRPGPPPGCAQGARGVKRGKGAGAGAGAGGRGWGRGGGGAGTG